LQIDNGNKTAFFEALDFYRGNKQQARRVAVTGYLYSMYHHRAANLMDYVLKTVEHREEVEAYVREKRSSSGSDSFAPVSEQDILHLAPATEIGLRTTHTETGYDMKRFVLSEVKIAQRNEKAKKSQSMNLPQSAKGKNAHTSTPSAAAAADVGQSSSSDQVLHDARHRDVRAAMLGFERRR